MVARKPGEDIWLCQKEIIVVLILKAYWGLIAIWSFYVLVYAMEQLTFEEFFNHPFLSQKQPDEALR